MVDRSKYIADYKAAIKTLENLATQYQEDEKTLQALKLAIFELKNRLYLLK